MYRTPVFIICSPRPLVGKTLIARLLTEFLLLKHGAVAAFDINLKEPSLLEFLPRVTETAEVDDTFGKMQLMDRLIVNDGLAKVIDLGFHAFDEFFKMTEEIGFLKEAARRNVVPIVLFIADTDRVSARSFPMLSSKSRPPPRAIDNGISCAASCPRRSPVAGARAACRVPETYIDRPILVHYLRAMRERSSD
jgi:hypothetical protein